jgi:hypothetical protein
LYDKVIQGCCAKRSQLFFSASRPSIAGATFPNTKALYDFVIHKALVFGNVAPAMHRHRRPQQSWGNPCIAGATSPNTKALYDFVIHKALVFGDVAPAMLGLKVEASQKPKGKNSKKPLVPSSFKNL